MKEPPDILVAQEVTTFERCACPICQRDGCTEFLHVPDRFELGKGLAYRLCRCDFCGMIYLNPRPREILSGRFYQHEAYLPFASATGGGGAMEWLYAGLRHWNLRWKEKLVSRFHSPGKLLDVGCGTGEFLSIMSKAGWEVAGLERDARAAEWGREHLKVPIQNGSIDDLAPGEFDVITLWHVLEHLYDPMAALLNLELKLNADGCLIVAVPNISSLEAAYYGPYWIALDAPRHVNFFSVASLSQLAAAADLRLIWWQQLPLDAFFNTLMSEQLESAAKNGSRWLLPLRLLRAGTISLASLVAGSRIPFFSYPRGATIIAVFEKS